MVGKGVSKVIEFGTAGSGLALGVLVRCMTLNFGHGNGLGIFASDGEPPRSFEVPILLQGPGFAIVPGGYYVSSVTEEDIVLQGVGSHSFIGLAS